MSNEVFTGVMALLLTVGKLYPQLYSSKCRKPCGEVLQRLHENRESRKINLLTLT